jgi:hypothetical protein
MIIKLYEIYNIINLQVKYHIYKKNLILRFLFI